MTIWEAGNKIIFLIISTIIISEVLDLMVRPYCFMRSIKDMPLRFLPVLFINGIIVLFSGSVYFSLFLGTLLLFVFVITSNLKLKLLNEPLVFTDLALLKNFINYPSLYIQAIPAITRLLGLAGIIVLLIVAVFTTSYGMIMRGEGGIISLFSACILWFMLERQTRPGGPSPALWKDVRKKGLLPTLLIYAIRWKREKVLPPQPALPFVQGGPESVIIIQCESFSDPACLNSAWQKLPELAQSQEEAILWGDFCPSGLGAYTMRSEYGVLCGGSDQLLSYRQFDPFLSATGMASHSLPHRLKDFYPKALFLHPYDLRFFGRKKLMPLLGFTDMVGEEYFKKSDLNGPYISDRAITEFLLDYLHKNENFLAYCVTMENHGPWKKNRLKQKFGPEAWYEHVQNGDIMLGHLRDAIKESGRDIMLVFFGDHRPALETVPPIEGLERSTSYVILRPNSKLLVKKPVAPSSLTPDGLHEAILKIITSKNKDIQG